MAEAGQIQANEDDFDAAFGEAVASVTAGGPLRDAPPIDADAGASKPGASDQIADASKKEEKNESADASANTEAGAAGTEKDQDGGGSDPAGSEKPGQDPGSEGQAGGAGGDGKSGVVAAVTAADLARLDEKLDKALTRAEPEKKESEKPAAGSAAVATEYEYSDDEKKILAEYAKEWDEHDKVLGIREKKLVHDLEQKFVQALDVVLQELNKGLAPVLESTVSLSRERHFSQIRAAHPDFEQHRDAVSKWIDDQPQYLKGAMRKVYDEGDTQGTIDLLTQYKRETEKSGVQGGQKVVSAAKDTVSEAKIAATAPVDARRTVVQTAGVDPNDFDAAWKEAVG